MALFKPFRGSRTSLDAVELHDGHAYFCIDDGSFHIDYADSEGNLHRKQINAKDAETLCGMTFDQIIEAANANAAAVLSEAQAYTDAAMENATTQDVAVLHEAQAYTDEAIANVKTPDPVSIDLSALDTEGKIIETFADGSTKTTMVEFDADGNPVKIIDADGNETVLTW